MFASISVGKRVVDLHQGRLYAPSDGVGRGSCFTLQLLLAADDALVVEAANYSADNLLLLTANSIRSFSESFPKVERVLIHS